MKTRKRTKAADQEQTIRAELATVNQAIAQLKSKPMTPKRQAALDKARSLRRRLAALLPRRARYDIAKATTEEHPREVQLRREFGTELKNVKPKRLATLARAAYEATIDLQAFKKADGDSVAVKQIRRDIGALAKACKRILANEAAQHEISFAQGGISDPLEVEDHAGALLDMCKAWIRKDMKRKPGANPLKETETAFDRRLAKAYTTATGKTPGRGRKSEFTKLVKKARENANWKLSDEGLISRRRKYRLW